ncbi:type II CAAX endopeptidase family protein [Angustibacter speluncae]
MPIRRVGGELSRFVHATFVTVVPRDHTQSDGAFVRRRWVAAVTLVVGSVLLGVSLNLEPGDPRFYACTFGLAAVWTVGAFASGPLHLGWAHTRREGLARPVVQPLCVGLAAVAVFLLGSLVVAQVPFLRALVDEVLDHARYASLPVLVVITLVNGIAEELFFRGAFFAAVGRKHAVALSAVVYTLATVATGNLMLVFAAALLGVVLGLQRRVTGGVLAPMITHVTWSLSMLLVLPWAIGALS